MDDEQALPPPKMGFEGKAAAAQASLGDDLWEMNAAGERLADFTAGRTFEEYAAHEALRAAAVSMLGVMGGALRRIAQGSPACAAKIDGPDLLELCDRLREGVAGDPEVWSFVRNALPGLRERTLGELEAWHAG